MKLCLVVYFSETLEVQIGSSFLICMFYNVLEEANLHLSVNPIDKTHIASVWDFKDCVLYQFVYHSGEKIMTCSPY